MDKKQRILIFGAAGVLLCLIGLVVWLIVSNQGQTQAAYDAQARADSLAVVNDQLILTNQFNQLNNEFSQFEGQELRLTNDSVVQKYNQARMKVEGLIQELNAEKAKTARSQKDIAQMRNKIKQMEAEIGTLKGIVKHYLAEIKRLGDENTGLKQEVQQAQARNEELSTKVTQATASNQELTQTVARAKMLNITGVSFAAYNKKGKVEKNITKAKSLGVHFTVSPNNTASAGMKTFYMRILSPEGALLGGGGSFTIDGKSVQSTASRAVEYANDELPVTIYWDVNTTLTPGDYTVEVFCDGNRLASRHFQMKK
ncbi:MAG: hypothetical protein K2M45_02355 [Muribaculaceae bacterium]|nr:hypothetical protein [Muribaculaceae bacterium]